MKAVQHNITHIYQTSNHNCSQASLAMVLSTYDPSASIEGVLANVPVNTDSKGEEIGTVKQHLALWCLSLGYKVDMYTFDCALIDQSWSKLKKSELLSRMKLSQKNRDLDLLGRRWSKVYIKSYIDFLQKDGNLHIKPYVSSDLIYRLLQNGPITAGVCYKTLHGVGHSKIVGLRKEEFYDIGKGSAGTHSIVLYGNDEEGSIFVADPWLEPGLHKLPVEQIIAAISAAQVSCDNLLFQITK